MPYGGLQHKTKVKKGIAKRATKIKRVRTTLMAIIRKKSKELSRKTMKIP